MPGFQEILLLDNFEQVVPAAPLLTALLGSSPLLKILVTSRSTLGLSGEYDFPVPCLPAPDPKQLPPFEQLVQNPAVALFLERATAVNPKLTLDQDNSRSVAEICFRLDGLPLAIELAAARVKILPPAAMLARLGNSLELLTSGPRDLPARQQTLRKTIDWSYSLLSAAEQTLFRRLAVFSSGCTLESTEAVCNTRRDLEIPVLDGISSMVNQHLLQREEEKTAEGRFTMLQTIREYALERLSASGEEEFTRRAHAAYCVVLAEEGVAELTEVERANWLTLWDAEYDNLRDALDWLIRTESGQWALRLGTALFAFWERREHLAEGRERLEGVLNMRSTAGPTGIRARARGTPLSLQTSRAISDAPSGSTMRACVSIANWAIAKALQFSSVMWGSRCVKLVRWQQRERSTSNPSLHAGSWRTEQPWRAR